MALGRRGESVAVRLIKVKGWCVLCRNLRRPEGEVDIVAMDGVHLIFVEVKAYRLGGSPGQEHGSRLRPRQLERLNAAAAAFVAEAGHPKLPWRIDLVEVGFGRFFAKSVLHMRDVG